LYPTEGARACLNYGFHQLKIIKIVAVAPIINTPSISSNEKNRDATSGLFLHPLLLDYPKLKKCVLFKIIK